MAILRFPWTFQIAAILLTLFSAARAQSNTPTFLVGPNPRSIVVGNFFGNSVPGVATANGNNTVTVLAGNGTGGFTVPGTTLMLGATPTAKAIPTAMAVGDFNRDGLPDLAIATATPSLSGSGPITGAVTVLLNSSGGFMLPGSTYAVGNNPSAVAVGDFNGDGYPDLAITNRDSNTVTVLLNNQNGGFNTGTTFTVGTSPSSVAVGDFNGDGYKDLAITNEFDNTVTLLKGDGMGGFTAFPASPFIVGFHPASVVVADFNGDGNLDLATANLSSNTVTVLLGNGTGGLTPVAVSPAVQGTAPVAMVVGDFNGDYIADLAIADSGSGTVTMLLGNGAGGFKPAPGSPFTAGTGPASLAVGDFNSDGVPDLVVANSGDDDIAVLLGTFTTTPAMVSAASYSTTAPVSPGSFVSIFATDSAITQAQSSSPPMTCLGNLGVTISDFSGAKTSLPLFYAGQSQSYAGPIQINAQIPQSVAAGAASFTVSIYTPPPTSTSTPCMSPQTGISQKGSITVAAVAPALFSANGIGKGLAAATFASVQTPAAQYVFMCPATGKCPPYVSNPIDVSEGDTFLVLYGTGIANRPGLSSVTVTVGSQALPALYAGPTPGFAGLDQVNVALPASLKGSGTVYVTVSISGTTSNEVTLDIM